MLSCSESRGNGGGDGGKMSPLMHFEALLMYVNTYEAPRPQTAHQLYNTQPFMAVPATQLSSHLCVLCPYLSISVCVSILIEFSFVCVPVCLCLPVYLCVCITHLPSHPLFSIASDVLLGLRSEKEPQKRTAEDIETLVLAVKDLHVPLFDVRRSCSRRVLFVFLVCLIQSTL